MKIAIAGYGIEGKSSYEYYKRRGDDITILDERSDLADLPLGVKSVLGSKAFENLADFDMVIRAPSLPPSRLETAQKVWSATNEFFAECPAPIIGVTGTKGKGTTASLIASILKKAGKSVYLVGNIGVPALNELSKVTPNDVVVYELSSFQLWDIKKSPHIAVVLMIEPDHLEVHMDFQEYVEAKRMIVAAQSENDTVVFAANNEHSALIANASKARKVGVQLPDFAHVTNGFFWYAGQKLCPVSVLTLAGTFNQDNACAAIAAVWEYVKDGDIIAGGLADFKGLSHRLKLVRKVNGVEYYDNSIGTTIGSAVASIRSFSQPKVVILGGSSKGPTNFDELATVAAQEGVKKAILIGEQAPVIDAAFTAAGVPLENLGQNVTMVDVVHHAQSAAASGDVVILSPACASFDMFKNYADRGDQFVAAVNSL